MSYANESESLKGLQPDGILSCFEMISLLNTKEKQKNYTKLPKH